jgi:hypothetical protein
MRAESGEGRASFRRSVVPSFCRSAVLPFCRSAVLSFRRSAVPSFRRSVVPSLRRSVVPSFFRSVTPFRHPVPPCRRPRNLLWLGGFFSSTAKFQLGGSPPIYNERGSNRGPVEREPAGVPLDH